MLTTKGPQTQGRNKSWINERNSSYLYLVKKMMCLNFK